MMRWANMSHVSYQISSFVNHADPDAQPEETMNTVNPPPNNMQEADANLTDNNNDSEKVDTSNEEHKLEDTVCMNPRIKTKPIYIKLTREDVHRVWLDMKLCSKYLNWTEQAIRKSTKDPPLVARFLQYMEYFVEECMFELNNIDTPCYKEENFGKSGASTTVHVAMSWQANNMIYEVIPRLSEYFSYCDLKPHKSLIFPVNHFFRLVLAFCRRCIELDIECFRLLETIFGFVVVPQDASKSRFYDVCGLPKSTGMHHGVHTYEWTPQEYGDGEMSVAALAEAYDKEDNFKYCGAQNEQSRQHSWFKVSNINYWGDIGGFTTMLKRIAYAKCPMAESDLVNLIRPMAQLRDLLNTNYFKSLVDEVAESLRVRYQHLPASVVCECLQQTVEKTIKNLHYMMNKHYPMKKIDESKNKLKLQIDRTRHTVDEMLTFGFCREMQQTVVGIPDDVFPVILAFYHIVWFPNCKE
eukprot:1037089_1